MSIVLGFHWQTDGDTDRAVIDRMIRKEITGKNITKLKTAHISTAKSFPMWNQDSTKIWCTYQGQKKNEFLQW